MLLVISGGTALQRCDKYALRCGSSRRETSTPQSSAKTPTTPPATHSSAKPTPRSGDAGTPTPRNAENSALIQSPHFSHVPASAPHKPYPPPPDVPSPPHAPESGASARYRSS